MWLAYKRKDLQKQDMWYLFTYLGVSASIKDTSHPTKIINQKILSYELFGNVASHAGKIKEYLPLIAADMGAEKLSDGYYIFKKENLKLDEKIGMIHSEALFDILATKQNNAPLLVTYYTHVESTANYITHVGFTSCQAFAERLGISYATSLKMMSNLEEIGVIELFTSHEHRSKCYKIMHNREFYPH